MKPAEQIHPALRRYSGHRTRPDRWADWQPNVGDIIICTPAKCGTTWTQAIVTMLLYGTVDLLARASALSPWVDSNLSDADNVNSVPLSASGRRVIKTHTPTDGFPVWKGVSVVAVYRHPLDVLLSVRKHLMNMKDVDGGEICAPLDAALSFYLNGVFDVQSNDTDKLATIATHYTHTLHRPDQEDLVLLHYADMIADHHGTVVHLARSLGIDADDALIDAITKATAIDAMRSDPVKFAPEGGKGFWHNDAGFFAKGGINQWREAFDDLQVAGFDDRLAVLVPDPQERAWIKFGAAA